MTPISEETIINAVQKINKSVVNIASVRMIHDQMYRVFPVEGVGSGIIIDDRGYILTNNHVIEDSDRLRVTLSDGRIFNGKIVGTDEITDLAVIKINSKENIPSADLGDSDGLKVGQIVFAIGNPFGLTGGPTVTSGILSSLNRSIQTPNGILDLIQTDAAINPGNSGGPLVNTEGKVIAINTANMPYAKGIGFAVPINTAKLILDDLIKNGRVHRPKIGIQTIKVTKQLARYYGLSTSEGALVMLVEPYGPADEAGLRKGDIIEYIDKNKVENPSELSAHVRKKKIGDKITLTVNRDGKTVEIPIQLDDDDANSYVRAVPVE